MEERLKTVLIYLAVFILLVLNSSGRIESVDGMSSLNMARSLVYKGDWSVAPPEYGIGGGTTDADAEGKYYSGASKGLALAMIPAVLVTKLIYDANGFTPTDKFPLDSDYLMTFLASFTNPVLAFIFFIVNVEILKLITKNKKEALIIGLIISLTTNLLPLAKHGFVHMLMVLLMSVIFLGILKIRILNRWWWIAPIIFSIIGLGLSYNITFLLAWAVIGYLLVDWLWQSKIKSKKKIIGLILVALVVMVLIFLLIPGGIQFLINNLRGEGNSRDMFQSIWGMLLSPGRSIFMFSPILILVVYKSFQTFKESGWMRLFIASILVYVGFYSMFDIWHGELSFGPRYISMIIPIGGWALASVWNQVNKKVVFILSLAGLLVQLIGITVPYDTQYQGMRLGNFDESQVKKRQDWFDYWNMGEFLPKYSPIYRLKTNMVKRWIMIEKVIKPRGELEMAGGSSVTFGDFKQVANKLVIDSVNPIDIDSVEIKAPDVQKKIVRLEICQENQCKISNVGKINKDKKIFLFNQLIEINKGRFQITFLTNLPEKLPYRFNLYELKLGNKTIPMNNYKLALNDSFLEKKDNLISENLKDKFYEIKSVENLTADFWWVRIFVYYNLPIILKGIFWILILIEIGLVGLLMGENLSKTFLKSGLGK